VIDGSDRGTVSIPFVMTLISSVGPSVGYDHGSPVSSRYRGPFPFEGQLSRLDVALVRNTGDEDALGGQAAEREAMARQ
jgi:arylsulfatase